jgi:hypothetical protein
MQITKRTTRTVTDEELITIPTQQLFAEFPLNLYASITPIRDSNLDPTLNLIYHCITIQLSNNPDKTTRSQIHTKTIFANSLFSSPFNDPIIEQITQYLLNHNKPSPFFKTISQTEFKDILHQATKHILEDINHPIKIQ